ncbi:hypothetical protein FA13DRAFT_1794759 [Coprinellus micaceus]|uniref:Uncharacterized protein n=1 Tax=Coprinellus micaceus TaxID=71717 RepID=A0A4Y7T0F5_COPMI|nr:hypothetical protein FA13DRAFT_1794759 [Coprinellus micaceus]
MSTQNTPSTSNNAPRSGVTVTTRVGPLPPHKLKERESRIQALANQATQEDNVVQLTASKHKKKPLPHPITDGAPPPEYWKASLGYGETKVVFPPAGYPPIVSHPNQRAQSKANLAAFRKLGGVDGSGLQRTVENALIVLVSKAMIDLTSLTKDPSGPIQKVRFNPGVEGKLILVDGYHRKLVAQEYMESFIQTEADLRLELQEAPEDKKGEIEANLALVQKTIDENGYWVIHYLCEETMQTLPKAQTALFEVTVGQNNKHKALANTPEETWRITFTGLASAKSVEDIEGIKQAATGVSSGGAKKDFAKLFKKGYEQVAFYQELYTVPAFPKILSFTVQTALDLQRTGWAFFSAILKPSWLVAKYMCSTLPLPPPSDSNITWTLARTLEQEEDGIKVSAVVLQDLVNCAAGRFYQHLRGVFNHFGTTSTIWAKAYKEYFSSLHAHLKATFQRKRPTLSPTDRTAYQLLLKKLPILYGSTRAACGPGLVPNLDGDVPIICPWFCTSLQDAVAEMEHPINLISTMLSPGMKVVADSMSSRGLASLHYSSLDGAIPTTLRYQLYYGCDSLVDEDGQPAPNHAYKTSTPWEMMDYTRRNKTGQYWYLKAWGDILAIFFRFRISIMLPLLTPIQTLYAKCPWGPKKVTLPKDITKLHSQVQQHFLNQFMPLWESEIQVDNNTARSSRLLVKPGPLAQASLSKLTLENHKKLGQAISKALGCIPWNVMHSRNKKENWKKLLQDLCVEHQWKHEVDQYLEDEEGLSHVFFCMFKAIRGNSGFKHFRTWFALPTESSFIPPNHTPNCISNNKFTHLKTGKKLQVDKAFNTLVKTLIQEHVGGVSVPGKAKKGKTGKGTTMLDPRIVAAGKEMLEVVYSVMEEDWDITEALGDEDYEAPVLRSTDFKQVHQRSDSAVDWKEASLGEVQKHRSRTICKKTLNGDDQDPLLVYSEDDDDEEDGDGVASGEEAREGPVAQGEDSDMEEEVGSAGKGMDQAPEEEEQEQRQRQTGEGDLTLSQVLLLQEEEEDMMVSQPKDKGREEDQDEDLDRDAEGEDDDGQAMDVMQSPPWPSNQSEEDWDMQEQMDQAEMFDNGLGDLEEDSQSQGSVLDPKDLEDWALGKRARDQAQIDLDIDEEEVLAGDYGPISKRAKIN